MTDDGLGTAGSMLERLINRVEKEEPGLREGELRHFIAAFAETDDFSTRFELVKGTTLYRSGDPEKAALDERILLKILSELDDDRDIKLDFTLASLECHQPDKMLYPGLWAFFEEVARDHWGVFLRYLHRIGTDESNDFFRKDAFYRKPEFTGFLKLLVKAFPEGRDELEELFLWNDILTEIYNVVIFSTDPAPDPMEEKERIKISNRCLMFCTGKNFPGSSDWPFARIIAHTGKGIAAAISKSPLRLLKICRGTLFRTWCGGFLENLRTTPSMTTMKTWVTSWRRAPPLYMISSRTNSYWQ